VDESRGWRTDAETTCAIEATPLIASSIMSKKIAEGTDALVLDVKFGSGAFLKDIEQSRELAKVMVRLGEDAGVDVGGALAKGSALNGLAPTSPAPSSTISEAAA